jgi:hypothetical protein
VKEFPLKKFGENHNWDMQGLSGKTIYDYFFIHDDWKKVSK